MSLDEFFDNCEDGCCPDRPVLFEWSAKGVGFGTFFFYEKDGKVYCDNECMSKNFIKQVLNQMVDECILHDNKEEK